MNAKTTIILLACLLAAVAGLYFIQAGEQQDGEPKPTSRKLVDLEFNDVRAYEIKPNDEPARAFVRLDDNNWKMTAPIETSAQGSVVESDVRKVLDLQFDKSYSPKDDPPGDELTSLNAPLAVIKISDNNDQTHLLKIGARQQLSEKTYVQKVGSDLIYLVPGDLRNQFDKKLHEYRSKRLMNFRAADVVHLEVSGETNFVAVKDGSGWTIEAPFQARADMPTLNRAASALGNIFVVDFIEDNPATLRPYGLDPPRLTATVTWRKEAPAADDDETGPTATDQITKSATIAFGAKSENNVFARLVEDEPDGLVTVFQVSESTVQNIGPSATDLRDKRVAQFNQPLVSRIEYEADDDAIALSKSGSDWLVMGESDDDVFAERSAVDDFLRVLKNLKAEGFEEQKLPKHGLDQPRAAIKLNLGSQGETTILVGAETPSKTGVYIQNISDDTVAVVPTAEAEKILVSPISFYQRTVFNFDANAVTGLELRRGNTQIGLQKTDDGWAMTNPVQGRGQADNISSMLAALAQLRAMRVVGRAEKSDRFGLDAPQYSTAITVAADPPAADETIAFTAVRHEGSRYLIKDDGAFVFEIDEQSMSELDKEFLTTEMFAFAPEDITRVSFSGETVITFERSPGADEAWSLVDEPTFDVALPTLSATLDALANLNCERYVSYDDAELESLGLTEPWRTVSVALKDGSSITLEIADRGPNAADRYARRTDQPQRAFVLLGTVVSQFNKSASDFKKP